MVSAYEFKSYGTFLITVTKQRVRQSYNVKSFWNVSYKPLRLIDFSILTFLAFINFQVICCAIGAFKEICQIRETFGLYVHNHIVFSFLLFTGDQNKRPIFLFLAIDERLFKA